MFALRSARSFHGGKLRFGLLQGRVEIPQHSDGVRCDEDILSRSLLISITLALSSPPQNVRGSPQKLISPKKSPFSIPRCTGFRYFGRDETAGLDDEQGSCQPHPSKISSR